MRSRLIHWNYFNIFSFSLIWGSKLLDRYQGLLDTSVLLSKFWKTTGQTSAVDSSVKLHCRVLLATKLKRVANGNFPKFREISKEVTVLLSFNRSVTDYQHSATPQRHNLWFADYHYNNNYSKTGKRGANSNRKFWCYWIY